MEIKQISDVLLEVRIPYGEDALFFLGSDFHYDNPKCQRDKLHKHLDYVAERNGRIFVFGDFFCMMQGKYDPRSSKKDIRPEHNTSNYIDAVIEDTVAKLMDYPIALVSKGNHECYRKDTEVLTDKGWKLITEVTTEDNVAVFNNDTIWYEKPIATVSKTVEGLYTIESMHTKQIVSPNHAVVLRDGTKVNAKDLVNIYDRDLPCNMKIAESVTTDISANMVELITAVVMDATLIDHSKYVNNSIKRRIQFKVSKPEKIVYITKLLNKCNVEYTLKPCKRTGLNKLEPFYIRIYSDPARAIFNILNGTKELPASFATLTGEHFDAMLTAIKNTDSYKCCDNTIAWRTIDKHNVDIVQAACTLNGKICTYKLREKASGFDNGKPQYIVTISDTIVKSKKVKINYEAGEIEVYCLSMPQGNFISRIEGKPAFSGNTSILNRLETDVIKRFVDISNLYKTPEHKVYAGGYHGFIKFVLHRNGANVKTYMLYYHHGLWGGVVSRGFQANSRYGVVTDADFVVSGHVHQRHLAEIMRYDITKTGTLLIKPQYFIKSGTYKEEYAMANGWAIEKIGLPGNIGGWYLEIKGTDRDNISIKINMS